MTSAFFAPIGGILGPLDWPELLLLLLVVMLIFGGKKLPELARGLGKSIREFKKATTETEDAAPAEARPESTTIKNNGATKSGVDTTTSASK
jgi:sec-independent protein translocase protein TatA